MKLALLIVVLTAIVTVNVATVAEEVETAWLNFQSKYRKQYKSLDNVSLRKATFADNFNKITEHNKLYEQGKVTYSLIINKFADMTDEELRNAYKGYKTKNVGLEEIEQFVPDKTKEIPDTFDWREKGAVTPVKDQGFCGSCWAFSTTGALEGQQFVKTGKLVSISEQNLVDCSGKYNNLGCDGGEMNAAFQYVHDNDGIDSEEGYPYEAKTLQCRYKLEANVTSAKGYAQIESGNEDALKAAIATIGPISVGIDASQDDFMSYHTGVYYNILCHNGSIDPMKELDHAVLAVGYGTEGDQDYWLIKNSWAEDWGEQGYIRMARNRNDNCGVAADASYPVNY